MVFAPFAVWLWLRFVSPAFFGKHLCTRCLKGNMRPVTSQSLCQRPGPFLLPRAFESEPGLLPGWFPSLFPLGLKIGLPNLPQLLCWQGYSHNDAPSAEEVRKRVNSWDVFWVTILKVQKVMVRMPNHHFSHYFLPQCTLPKKNSCCLQNAVQLWRKSPKPKAGSVLGQLAGASRSAFETLWAFGVFFNRRRSSTNLALWPLLPATKKLQITGLSSRFFWPGWKVWSIPRCYWACQCFVAVPLRCCSWGLNMISRYISNILMLRITIPLLDIYRKMIIAEVCIRYHDCMPLSHCEYVIIDRCLLRDLSLLYFSRSDRDAVEQGMSGGGIRDALERFGQSVASAARLWKDGSLWYRDLVNITHIYTWIYMT